jgi:hypothetical protein
MAGLLDMPNVPDLLPVFNSCCTLSLVDCLHSQTSCSPVTVTGRSLVKCTSKPSCPGRNRALQEAIKGVVSRELPIWTAMARTMAKS